MDLPSAAETQAQYRRKGIHHNKQQRHQQQDSDQSQVQDYEAYYLYAQPYALHQQYHPQPPYFAYDYGNAMAAVNAFQEVATLQQELQTSYEFPPGLEPAAAAAVSALSQVSQFAGKMDAVEQALVRMPEQLWTNGAYIQTDCIQSNVSKSLCTGTRGDESFMGNTGCFDPHQRWSDTGASDGRGRDRTGRNGRKRFQRNASDVILLSYEPALHQEPQSEDALATQSTAAEATESAAARTTAQGRQWQTPQTARCDLCKVDCNTQEILQQHKSGKRHKKNLQKLEESEESENILSKSQQAPGQRGFVLGVEEINQTSVEDLPKATVATNENETEERTTLTEEQVEVLTTGLMEATTGRLRMDGSFEYQGHLPKLKVQKKLGPRGGKRLRQSESVSCSGAPKVLPKYCSLCHVTCDTQAVFESHLAGKKHTSRVKRAKNSQVKYVAVGLHALYMPDARQTGLEARGKQESQIGGQKSIV